MYRGLCPRGLSGWVERLTTQRLVLRLVVSVVVTAWRPTDSFAFSLFTFPLFSWSKVNPRNSMYHEIRQLVCRSTVMCRHPLCTSGHFIYIKHKTFSIFLPPLNYKLLFLHHLSSGVVFGVAEITGWLLTQSYSWLHHRYMYGWGRGGRWKWDVFYCLSRERHIFQSALLPKHCHKTTSFSPTAPPQFSPLPI